MNFEYLVRNYWPFIGLALVLAYFAIQKSMSKSKLKSSSKFSIGDEIELTGHGTARISDIHIYEVEAEKFYEYEIILGHKKSFVTIDDGGVHLTTKELDFELLHLSEDDRELLYKGELKKIHFEDHYYHIEESYEGFFYQSSNMASSEEFFCCEYKGPHSTIMSICMFENGDIETSIEKKLG